MQKNKFLKGLLLSTSMMLALSVFTIPVMAETADTQETQASITFESGLLTLESAPNFNFGTHAIPSAISTYTSEASTDSLLIADVRGSSAGWSVTAALNPFQNGGDTLAGSSITLEEATVTAEEGTVGTAPTQETSVVLTSDGVATSIQKANAGEGTGLWSTSWGSAVLTVYPGTAKTGVNTGTIDWTLSDAP